MLSVWASTGDNGTLCVSPMFEAPGDLARPAPTDVQLGGGQCANLDQRDQPFGTMSGPADERGFHMMWGSAGKAVRAELRLHDGSVRAAVPAEGMFFVWYLADHHVDAPVLLGYDAGGRVVTERQLPNLIAQEHIGG